MRLKADLQPAKKIRSKNECLKCAQNIENL
jgi:hypothetical protein